MTAALTVTREDVLRFRFARHQLDREPRGLKKTTDVDLLDYGVQDTGTDGARWALAIRGAGDGDGLFFAWTLRGAPHAYRRSDVAAIATATAPFSEADAAKRIFDASKPLRDAGVPILDALRTVADEMRDLAKKPIAKGDASGALTHALPAHFLRFCRACDATHIYEQPFRLSAFQAGLELQESTSPPVLQRIPRLKPLRYASAGSDAKPQFHVVRNYVRFYGPARIADATAFIDAAAKDVKAQWPQDVVPVTVKGESSKAADTRWLLEDDVEALAEARDGDDGRGIVRLLAPHDPYLQLRDRELLVTNDARRKDVWRVIGRPGGIAVDGDLVGTWRPRSAGRKLTIAIEMWKKPTSTQREAVEHEAERLAVHRGVDIKAVDGLA